MNETKPSCIEHSQARLLDGSSNSHFSHSLGSLNEKEIRKLFKRLVNRGSFNWTSKLEISTENCLSDRLAVMQRVNHWVFLKFSVKPAVIVRKVWLLFKDSCGWTHIYLIWLWRNFKRSPHKAFIYHKLNIIHHHFYGFNELHHRCRLQFIFFRVSCGILRSKWVRTLRNGFGFIELLLFRFYVKNNRCSYRKTELIFISSCEAFNKRNMSKLITLSKYKLSSLLW